MKMLNSKQKQIAGNHLVDLIKKNGGKLSTGFLGVRPLLPALSETGHSDEAYKLFLSTEYPSWCFEVKNGANTIWERWDSYIKGQGFKNNAGMNSFNHYAFGSVNEWMFGNVAGIKVDAAGYRSFTVKPEIAKIGINYVKAIFHSIKGEISSSWKKTGDKIIMDVTVPVNTKATVFILAKNKNNVLEDSKPLKNSEFLKIGAYKDGYLKVEIGSGDYHFSSEI